jgi:hypothetical protein
VLASAANCAPLERKFKLKQEEKNHSRFGRKLPDFGPSLRKSAKPCFTTVNKI